MLRTLALNHKKNINKIKNSNISSPQNWTKNLNLGTFFIIKYLIKTKLKAIRLIQHGCSSHVVAAKMRTHLQL